MKRLVLAIVLVLPAGAPTRADVIVPPPPPPPPPPGAVGPVAAGTLLAAGLVCAGLWAVRTRAARREA